ncbi:unnamed protein product, partial [Amoebophrya sp. A25]
ESFKRDEKREGLNKQIRLNRERSRTTSEAAPWRGDLQLQRALWMSLKPEEDRRAQTQGTASSSLTDSASAASSITASASGSSSSHENPRSISRHSSMRGADDLEDLIFQECEYSSYSSSCSEDEDDEEQDPFCFSPDREDVEEPGRSSCSSRCPVWNQELRRWDFVPRTEVERFYQRTRSSPASELTTNSPTSPEQTWDFPRTTEEKKYHLPDQTHHFSDERHHPIITATPASYTDKEALEANPHIVKSESNILWPGDPAYVPSADFGRMTSERSARRGSSSSTRGNTEEQHGISTTQKGKGYEENRRQQEKRNDDEHGPIIWKQGKKYDDSIRKQEKENDDVQGPIIWRHRGD